jgi:molecular chaperone GrpE
MADTKDPKKQNKTGDKKQLKPRAPTTSSQKKVQHQLKKAQAEIAQFNDQLLRSAAELGNVRKRAERDIAQIIKRANENLIRDILPVLDDFERSLKTSQQEVAQEEFYKGMGLIHQKLNSILIGYGLEPMESVGKEFDVDLHEAFLQIEKKGTPSDQVIEDHEKGYLLNGQVLRHAKVVVSK